MEHTDNYKKHTNKNPIQKFLLYLFYQAVLEMLQKIKVGSILDVGSGEGFTLAKLKKEHIGSTYEGIEYKDAAIALGKKHYPDIQIRKGSIYKLPYKTNAFDTVLCTEVLEHLDDPQMAIKELVRVTKKYALLSVPNEPFFMLAQLARGKNWSRWGNDIEHINHWTFFGFQKFVGTYFVIRAVKVPFFWTILLCEKR
ncbi:MAG: methyltransferase domain-containing protein [Candidatus Levyibacteriota bacterium]